MAAYNEWMNSRLYAVCAAVSDDERRRDRGAFFKSIHGTLNHLLLADKVWLGRFLGEPFAVKSLDQELFHAFEDLERARVETDRQIVGWAATLTDEVLAGTLNYTSISNPAPHSVELSLAVMHLFNHQTHHRGQLTTLLGQCGKDYGVTDLLALPEDIRRGAARGVCSDGRER
jgi:uncharacterized damage-inducible protein DinB